MDRETIKDLKETKATRSGVFTEQGTTQDVVSSGRSVDVEGVGWRCSKGPGVFFSFGPEQAPNGSASSRIHRITVRSLCKRSV